MTAAISSSSTNPLRAALRACRQALLIVGGFSLVMNLLMLAMPLYMMQVFDRVLTGQNLDTLAFLTLLAIVAVLLLSALEVLRGRILTRAMQWLDRVLGGQTIERLIEARLTGRSEAAEPLRDLAQVRGFLGGAGIFPLFDAPWVPLYLAAVYLLNPWLGLLATVGAVLLFALAVVNEMALRAPLGRASLLNQRNLQAIESAVQNAEVVDAMGMLPGILARWQAGNDAAQAEQELASDRAGLLIAATKGARLLVQVATYGFGALLVVRQELTGGAMIGGSIIMARALAPIEQAMGTWKQLVSARESWRRLDSFFDRPRLRVSDMTLPSPEGRLSVEQLLFGFPGATEATVRSISFALEAGESLAIVGPSAAGKTSLIRLIVGTLRPTAGHVRLDGADVFQWRRDAFGRHVGYLPQDVELFAGSVRENIARFSEASDEAVIAAAQMAGCHEMILRLPLGYETQIGEGGALLSGGQRQRIGLARALIGRPRLVVLDEPNANLDGEGEAALMQALAALKRDRVTVVVVSHRPSLVAHVDKMLVMRAGALELFGPREPVLERLNRPAGTPMKVPA
jgi:ATP-binding cassette subfamily C protein/ATP-binding cassette subfamily C protein EexD